MVGDQGVEPCTLVCVLSGHHDSPTDRCRSSQAVVNLLAGFLLVIPLFSILKTLLYLQV